MTFGVLPPAWITTCRTASTCWRCKITFYSSGSSDLDTLNSRDLGHTFDSSASIVTSDLKTLNWTNWRFNRTCFFSPCLPHQSALRSSSLAGHSVHSTLKHCPNRPWPVRAVVEICSQRVWFETVGGFVHGDLIPPRHQNRWTFRAISSLKVVLSTQTLIME